MKEAILTIFNDGSMQASQRMTVGDLLSIADNIRLAVNQTVIITGEPESQPKDPKPPKPPKPSAE